MQMNLKDANLQAVARKKAEASRQAATSFSKSQPKYRDRASERRIMHNQPDIPPPEPKEKSAMKKRADARPRSPTPPRPPVNPGEDQKNIGNKLLKMMGWKEGTGLGTAGEGRVEPMCVSFQVPNMVR
jgi:RNA-binding protein 5/10